MKNRYKAVLFSDTGVLLGGYPKHESIWFSRKSDAKAWLTQCKWANIQAGRKPGKAKILESNRKINPEYKEKLT